MFYFTFIHFCYNISIKICAANRNSAVKLLKEIVKNTEDFYIDSKEKADNVLV